MIAEIHKIDLELYFRNVKNPHCKNLDLWGRIQVVQKIFS